MTPITCPSCGTPAPAGAIFCDNCGYDLRGVAPAAPAPAGPAFTPTPAGAITCPSCGHPNIAGSLFCEDCGAQLPSAPPPQPPVSYTPPVQQPNPPAPVQPPYQPPVAPSVAAAPVQPPPYQAPAYQPPAAPPQQAPYQPPSPPYPPAAYSSNTPSAVVGRLVVQSTGASLLIPPGKQAVTIGREDPVSGIFPEVDLDPHGGQDAGVGRQHARLTSQAGQVFIEDLNSVNGTLLNKQKIAPGQPRPLNHGDEIRLGKLALTYYSS